MPSTSRPEDLSVAALARDAWRLVRTHPLPFALPFVLLSLLAGSGSEPTYRMDAVDVQDPDELMRYVPLFAFLGLLALVVVAVLFVVSVTLAATVARAMFRTVRSDSAPDLGSAFREARATWGQDAATALLAMGIVILGFILLVVPGFIAMAALTPILAVLAAEPARRMAAVRRSFDLARGHKGRLLLLVLGAGVASILAQILLAWIPLMGGALADAAGGVVNATLVAAGVLFYHRRTATPDQAPAGSAPRAAPGGPVA